MARKFLYIVALLIVLVVAAGLALHGWQREISRQVFVPRVEFKAQAPLQLNAYDDPKMWFSRPEAGEADPARWLPSEWSDPDEWVELAGADAAKTPRAAVFFVHPTSYLEREHWNAPLDDRTSQGRARIFIKGMASPFTLAGEVWAPRYRQAAFGAFLTDAPAAAQAIDAAYADVAEAFAAFLAEQPRNRPIILAGHSQGALHVIRLVHEKVVGTPLAERLVAAYAIGWPISVEHDLPVLGIPACAEPDQTGCIVSWSSFGEPADPGLIIEDYANSLGLDGQPRGNGEILCSNPLTGGVGGSAPVEANLGTLVPNKDLTEGSIVSALVPARCEGGLLLLGEPPDLGPYVLPGNNYHVYDIPLFWANLRRDVATRIAAWRAAR